MPYLGSLCISPLCHTLSKASWWLISVSLALCIENVMISAMNLVEQNPYSLSLLKLLLLRWLTAFFSKVCWWHWGSWWADITKRWALGQLFVNSTYSWHLLYTWESVFLQEAVKQCCKDYKYIWTKVHKCNDRNVIWSSSLRRVKLRILEISQAKTEIKLCLYTGRGRKSKLVSTSTLEDKAISLSQRFLPHSKNSGPFMMDGTDGFYIQNFLELARAKFLVFKFWLGLHVHSYF